MTTLKFFLTFLRQFFLAFITAYLFSRNAAFAELTFISILVHFELFTRVANMIPCLLSTAFAKVGMTFAAYDLVLSQMFCSRLCQFFASRVNCTVNLSRQQLRFLFAIDASLFLAIFAIFL